MLRYNGSGGTMKDSIGVKACIEVLQWFKPRVLGGLICLAIFFFFPVFVIQAFFVSKFEDLWVHKMFKLLDDLKD